MKTERKDFREVINDSRQSEFYDLVVAHKTASLAKKEAEDEMDRLGKELRTFLDEDESLLVDGFVVTCVGSKNVTVDKKLLLANGVSVATIEKCTKETPYSYVKVSIEGE